MPSNQYALLRQQRFLPLFLVQAAGAMNDNVLRFGLIFMLQAGYFPATAIGKDALTNLSAALFIAPYFLFSAIAGQLADKLDKARLIRWLKTLEVIAVAIAAIAILTGTMFWTLVLLAIMGFQSTLFGPVKYAILPQVLNEDELLGGNGLIEGATYVAIVVGTIIGSAAIVLGSPAWLASVIVTLALFGRLAAHWIPATQPATPELAIDQNLLRSTFAVVRDAHRNRPVYMAIIGISWFWAYGLIVMTQLPALANDWLGAGSVPMVLTLLPVTFAIGVGIGSLLCERLSKRRIELGLVPIGAAGLTVFMLDVGLALGVPIDIGDGGFGALASEFTFWRVIFDLIATGIAGGLYSVPLYALIQQRSPARQRARVIAANNIVNAIFMVIAALVTAAAMAAAITVPTIYFLTGVATIVVTAYLLFLLPEFVMRLVTWVLVNLMYRVDVKGHENIPASGPVLVTANHVSFVDALLIGGLIQRPIRFVMYYKIFAIPVLSWIFKTAKAIPIAGYRENPEMLAAAYVSIDEQLANAQAVGIFPEGAITHDGEIAPFKSGIENIVARRPVVVVPVALVGLWGSWFSRKGGAAGKKLPRRFRAKITLNIGEPIAAGDVDSVSLQRRVQSLHDAVSTKSQP